MDVIAAVASITQLAAYTQSAAQVLTRLYKELRDGPPLWREQASNIQHLLVIIDRVSHTSQQVQQEVRKQLLALLRESNEVAIKALDLILKAKSPGFLGVRWTLISGSEALTQTLESLRSKTEILQLLLSGAILANSINPRPKLDVEREAMNRDHQDIHPPYDMADNGRTATLTLERIEIGDYSSSASQNGWGELLKSQNGWEQLVKSQGIKVGGVKSGKYAADHSNNFGDLNAAHHQEQMKFCERMRERERADGELEEEDSHSSETELDQPLKHVVGARVVHRRTASFRIVQANSGPSASFQTAPNKRDRSPREPRLRSDARQGRTTSSASYEPYGELWDGIDRMRDRRGSHIRERGDRDSYVARRFQNSNQPHGRIEEFDEAGRRIY